MNNTENNTLPDSSVHKKTRNHDDLTGFRFGRLTVLSKKKRKNVPFGLWLCQCSCGKKAIVRRQSLVTGDSQSCGCLRQEKMRKRGLQVGFKPTHGLSSTRGYTIWAGMMNRCHNPNLVGYKYYGARGISVCKEWHNVEVFLRDMGQPPEGMWIERLNNDGNYCPENCKWATPKQQALNKRRGIKIFQCPLHLYKAN